MALTFGEPTLARRASTTVARSASEGMRDASLARRATVVCFQWPLALVTVFLFSSKHPDVFADPLLEGG
jgi:hypothetical protein